MSLLVGRFRRFCRVVLLPPLLFAAEHERPIGTTDFALGHPKTGCAHIWAQEVCPVAGTSLPAAHHVAERFMPGGHVF
jgi:hypothetical protein